MRTTIRIDDDLLKEAKAVAAAGNRTLTEVIEDALRESLARRRATAGRARVKLPTFKGDGLQPGVDLNDSAALLDLRSGATLLPDVNVRVNAYRLPSHHYTPGHLSDAQPAR